MTNTTDTPLSWQEVPGWFDFESIYFCLADTLPRDAIVIEVGAWFGRSVIALAQHLQRHHRDDVRLIAVDTFEGSDEPAMRQIVESEGGSIRAAFDRYCQLCGVAERIEVIAASSSTAARRFRKGTVDFIFIDAGHDYADVSKDIASWSKKLTPRGLIGGHDVDRDSVRQAVDEAYGDRWIRSAPRSWIYQPIRLVDD